jgi:two-component system, NtrC family, sensor histidine kinase HydH
VSDTTRDRVRFASILGLILLISVFHYRTSTHYLYLHEIYQRIYYIPIVLAAFWYGPIGGLAAAFLTSSIYYYHIHADWGHLPSYSYNQYAEIALYHVVAVIIGLLAEKEKRQRRKLEETSEELRAAYRKIQDTFEHLKQADRLAAVGELSAGIAHEIRNPLATIKGAVEILQSEIPEEHPKREFVQVVREETARVNKIITEFLTFARPPSPSFGPANLNEVVESTLLLLRKEAETADVRIVTNLAELPTVSVDRDQIRQVVLNVVLNGIQAMPEGGELCVRTFYEANPDMIAIEIRDTGPGMRPAQLDKIFDPFFTTKPGGTGLGLSISYQLVKHHGGTIAARANSGGGLTFEIHLPTRHENVVPQGAQKQRQDADFHGSD